MIPFQLFYPTLKLVMHRDHKSHGITESLRLEKTSKIIKTNHHPNTNMPAKPCPQVPHLHFFWDETFLEGKDSCLETRPAIPHCCSQHTTRNPQEQLWCLRSPATLRPRQRPALKASKSSLTPTQQSTSCITCLGFLWTHKHPSIKISTQEAILRNLTGTARPD